MGDAWKPFIIEFIEICMSSSTPFYDPLCISAHIHGKPTNAKCFLHANAYISQSLPHFQQTTRIQTVYLGMLLRKKFQGDKKKCNEKKQKKEWVLIFMWSRHLASVDWLTYGIKCTYLTTKIIMAGKHQRHTSNPCIPYRMYKWLNGEGVSALIASWCNLLMCD